MCLFRPDKNVAISYFMYVLNGPQVRKQATQRASGSAHPHLNLGDIKGLVFALPPVAEQHRIVAEVDRRLSLVRGVESEVDANLNRAQMLRQATLAATFRQEA
jgi:type I restriction enzyme S subunit